MLGSLFDCWPLFNYFIYDKFVVENVLVNFKDENVKKEKIPDTIKRESSIYILLLSLFELSDKIFGATYIAFMRLKGLSLIQISNLFSIEQLLIAFFDYPTGAIADKFGRKKVFSLGFLSWGTGIILFCIGVNYIVFLLAIIFLALGIALISGAPSAWFVDQMIAKDVYEKRGRIYPKVQSVISLFSIIAAILSYLLLNISSQFAIMTAGIISMCAGIFGLLIGEDNYGNLQKNNISKALLECARDFFSTKYLIILSVKLLTGYISFIAFVLYWQVYATEYIGLDTEYLGIAFILFMMMLMLGNYIVSQLSRYIKIFNIIILGFIISAFGYIIFFINTGDSLFLFLAGAVFIEFGFGAEQAATSVWMCDYVKSEVRSTYSSIFSTIECLGGFVIINILGIIVEARGVNAIWILCFTSIFLTIIILIYLDKVFKNVGAEKGK